MSRRRKAQLLVMAGAGVMLASVLGVGGAGAATSRAPASAAAAGAVSHVINQTPAQVKAYWTPQRMRAALRRSPAAPALTPHHAAAWARNVLPSASAPPTMPRLPGRAGARPLDLPTGGPFAQPWPNPNDEPSYTVGILYFNMPDGVPAQCTAAVITAANNDTLWTAGHCVYNQESQYGIGWMTNVMFAPDTAPGNATPLGSWYARGLVTTNGWMNSADADYDLAAVVLSPGGNANQPIQPVTGAEGYLFNSGTYVWNVYIFGHPTYLTAPQQAVDPLQLRWCQGSTLQDQWWNTVMETPCDMASGSSGGPWLANAQPVGDGLMGQIVGNVSTGQECDTGGSSWDCAGLNSPYLGDGAVNVYNAAAPS
ncbi:MAG: trypsin-like serine protease [Streptosporangiaceae bacterium]|nr:trypsin-like serine protease [Streptosporangiaceae bacterium]